MTAILVVAGATLLASFFCSLFEAALYSVSPARVALLAQGGGAAATRLARMREDVEAPIAAILTVNTIAHTVGSAWCGAMVGAEYGDAALGVFASVFTFLVLALTEIVPKSLGVRYADRLAIPVVWPIQVMIVAVWPIVWIARRAMHTLTGPLAARGPSEDEIVVFTKLAARGGSVRRQERRWVENALKLDRSTAGELRTPRTVVETLDADLPVAKVVDRLERWVHSRVPIVEGGDSDRVVGIVHRREVVDVALRRPDGELLLRDLARPVRFVPESMPAHELLDLFLAEKMHICAVADEYGGFEGVVTLEDVLEKLLGTEIVDEHDPVEDMQKYALERARLRRLGSGSEGDTE
ncbi:MAG: hemolysin family protein [Planctomycetota bacterium]